jgi:hypothetical protein
MGMALAYVRPEETNTCHSISFFRFLLPNAAGVILRFRPARKRLDTDQHSRIIEDGVVEITGNRSDKLAIVLLMLIIMSPRGMCYQELRTTAFPACPLILRF